MSIPKGAQGRGPSWYDVGAFLKHLEQLYGCVVSYEAVYRPAKGGVPTGLTVYLWKRSYRAQGKPEDKVLAHGQWPSRDHSTMPGLIMYLCHVVENDILAASEKAAAAQSALPF